MHDSDPLTDWELEQIHGGASHLDSQGHVHEGDGGFPSTITLPDGRVIPLIPLPSAPPPVPRSQP